MRRSGFASLVLIAWLVIGVIVAANHHYFGDLKTLAVSYTHLGLPERPQ